MPTSVPTADEFQALSDRVDEIAETPAPTPSEPIFIQEWPHTAFQKEANEAALRAAVNDMLNTRSGANATKYVQMKPGNTRVTSPDLIGSPTNGTSDPTFGLKIKGMGARVTTLTFAPSGTVSTDPRKNNLFTLANRVRDFKMEDLMVQSGNAAANFMWAWSVQSTNADSIYPEYGKGQNQRFMFNNVEWAGHWNRGIGIDGDVNTNNNSEWTFDFCNMNTTTRFTEAFLQSGGISGVFPQQTQYLNYFINECNFTLLAGTVFRFIKGGNIHVSNGSWSAANNANAITWFDLQGSGSDSASMLTIKGTRFEPKAANQLIIDNKIGSGQVHFQDVIDVSSLQKPPGDAVSNWNLHRYTARNGRFPIVTYENCVLAGAHLYTGGNNNAPGKAIYKRSKFFQWTANNQVATAAGTQDGFLQYTGGRPRHRFEDNEGHGDLNYN